MEQNQLDEMKAGFETAFIDKNVASNLAYKPQFISNNYREGKKVLASIEDELLLCDQFQISVAFITMSGITPLLQTLKELEKRGIKGEILTTNYLNFSEPAALKKLNELSNITIKMFDVEASKEGFHTKGYIFRKQEIYRIIIGSSNMTSAALTSNREWNTRVISTELGEVAQDIVAEFNELWNSQYTLPFDVFYEEYKESYEIIKKQREIARKEAIPDLEKYRLKPNSMQVGFIRNLKNIVDAGESRALLISATGTGKTYASAFAMRELGYKKVLFLVHRGQLARQTKKSYERVFDKTVSMGLVGAGNSEYDKDYVFAMIQTLNRDEHLQKFSPEHFDCIILDEAHHSAAETYQKVMSYFKPKLWLGMTATPDKRDDSIEGKNIYEIFNHQIAYEIRLQQAMEENILCPFHYFGVSDVSVVDETHLRERKLNERDFRLLTGDERVKHIIEQAEFYGFSGDRVKGLIFCSRIDESVELSEKFNKAGFRTIALNGNASEDERAKAFERLAMDEKDSTEDMQPLDYIFSVEILNEGVDIVEVNQVIMLRPTESPIVFIQQLGRGLRKAEGKDYVVVLDFIGNYTNNFMIPVALSGDRSYNPDIIRKYVISGNSTIPGASTIHFDEIAKEKIFSSIDRIKGMKSIVKSSYKTLKNRLGRVPYLIDFYENAEVDPLVIIQEYKTYYSLLLSEEKELYRGKLSDDEVTILEYLSKTVLSGTRPYELEILKRLLCQEVIDINELSEELGNEYGFEIESSSLVNSINVLMGHFVINEAEYKKFSKINILMLKDDSVIERHPNFESKLQNEEFLWQINDIILVGLKRYRDKYFSVQTSESPFVLYEKYSRRDVSFLMNCGRDMSSTMYGMKRINDDAFIFVTYQKAKIDDDEKSYIDGKPDYADSFEDNSLFRWDSQIGRGIDSSYVGDVVNASRKHLLVKKSDAESKFYYMGQFDVVDFYAAKKKDNSGNERDITKFLMKMHNSVRDDLFRYLESSIDEEGENIG